GRASGPILVRADSAYYRHDVIGAIIQAQATFSVGARLDQAVRKAIASIEESAWVRIEYPQAIPDPETGEPVSAAEVAEIEYTAFTSKAKKHRITARLIVRRVPERNAAKLAAAGQDGLFDVWRYHGILTNNPNPLVVAEAQHRGHAIVEQVFADLKASALAHLPSKKHSANGAWLVAATIAYNLTRALGIGAEGQFAKAETATVRNRLINTPARISRSARRHTMHLPTRWPWAEHWLNMWNTVMIT
ncbi:MAG: transposase, partial [Actinomycetes bacterium]